MTELDFAATRHINQHPITTKTRRNIDHICVTTDLCSQNTIQAGAWDNFTPDGKLMSYHNGVYIDIHVSHKF